VGNALRGDDAVGPYIADHIEARDDLRIFDAGDKPEQALGEIEKLNASKIVIIDAADFGGAPGEVRPIDDKFIPETALSTHRFPIRIIAKLIEDDFGVPVHFLGIQPKQTALGDQMSDEVNNAADQIIEVINHA
jgi:hydrogenase 3 maturation protease